jgi:hypothetical protein
VDLPVDSSDRTDWRFAQTQQMVLLTGNRNMRCLDSLEQTIRDENTATSLPVITIASIDRLEERLYRERCAERLAGIAVDLNNLLGSGRLFIP